MKITIEPSDPHGPMGQGYPKVHVDTQQDGDTIDQAFDALRGALVAYGYSERTVQDYIREYAAVLNIAHGV